MYYDILTTCKTIGLITSKISKKRLPNNFIYFLNKKTHECKTYFMFAYHLVMPTNYCHIVIIIFNKIFKITKMFHVVIT